jgi:hypothetical protein
MRFSLEATVSARRCNNKAAKTPALIPAYAINSKTIRRRTETRPANVEAGFPWMIFMPILAGVPPRAEAVVTDRCSASAFN